MIHHQSCIVRKDGEFWPSFNQVSGHRWYVQISWNSAKISDSAALFEAQLSRDVAEMSQILTEPSATPLTMRFPSRPRQRQPLSEEKRPPTRPRPPTTCRRILLRTRRHAWAVWRSLQLPNHHAMSWGALPPICSLAQPRSDPSIAHGSMPYGSARLSRSQMIGSQSMAGVDMSFAPWQVTLVAGSANECMARVAHARLSSRQKNSQACETHSCRECRFFLTPRTISARQLSSALRSTL